MNQRDPHDEPLQRRAHLQKLFPHLDPDVASKVLGLAAGSPDSPHPEDTPAPESPLGQDRGEDDDE